MGAISEEDETGKTVAQEEFTNAAKGQEDAAEEDTGGCSLGCERASRTAPAHYLEESVTAKATWLAQRTEFAG